MPIPNIYNCRSTMEVSCQHDSQLCEGRHTLEQAGRNRGQPVADASAQAHASKRKTTEGKPPTGATGTTRSTMCMRDTY